MMMNDLESDLATRVHTTPLDVPVDVVLERGDQIRRRRRRRLTLGAAASLAAVVGTASFALPGGQPGGPPRADAAAWGPQAVNLDASQVAIANKLCSTESGVSLGDDARPIVADERGESTALVYRSGETLLDCLLEQRAGGPQVGSWGKHTQDLEADLRFAFLNLSYSPRPTDSSRIDDGVGIARVTDDVSAVHLDVDGQSYKAEVASGIAVFWLPRGITTQQLDTALVRTYDDEGEELDAQAIADIAFVD